jgi:hypothetical protein
MSAIQKVRPDQPPDRTIFKTVDPLVTFTQTHSRSLQEEFLNDVLFSLCALFYTGVVAQHVPWLTIGTHLVASATAALAIAIMDVMKKKTRRACEGLAVAVGACVTASAVTDVVFLAQLTGRYMDNSANEPIGFLSMVGPPHPVSFAVLFSTHLFSLGMAVYRAYRAGGELGASSSFVAIGAAFATALVYEVWLFDASTRRRTDAAFDAHPWVVLGFVGAPLFDAVTHFALPDQWGAQTVWIMLSIVLASEYITLVGSVSLFFSTESIIDGGSRAPGWTHKYPGVFAKAEAVFMIGVLVAAQACRCAGAAPLKARMQAGKWKTLATSGEADITATATKLGLFLCSMILAPICNIAILMQGESAMVSRFVLLLYTTQLYVRYWIQLGAGHWMVVMVVNVAGLLVDAAVCLEILYFNLLVRQPGEIEIIVVITTALSSAVVCFMGLTHHIHQRVQRRKAKGN